MTKLERDAEANGTPTISHLSQSGGAYFCPGTDQHGRNWLVSLFEAGVGCVAQVRGASKEEAEANAEMIVRLVNGREVGAPT